MTAEQLANRLKNSIAQDTSAASAIQAFFDACLITVQTESDYLLFQSGTYAFGGADEYSFSLTRQVDAPEGEYYQITLNVTFAPDNGNGKFNTLFPIDNNQRGLKKFIKKVQSSKEYAYVLNNEYKSIYVTFEET